MTSDILFYQKLHTFIGILGYWRRRFPGLSLDERWKMSEQTFQDFLTDEHIEVGDTRYCWTIDGGRDIAEAYDYD